MSWWKQTIVCVVVLIASAVIWYLFFPGAQQVAANWGIGNPPATSSAGSPGPRGPGQGGPGGRGPGGPGGPGGGMSAGVVILEKVGTATINDRLSAIGTGSALHSVAVRPYSSGRLTEILVEPGTEIRAGDVLARMDSEAEKIAVDRAQLSLEDNRAKLERAKTLSTSNNVSAVQLRDAELALRNAELQLRESQLALERREILAPINGVVGILPVSPGDYVTSSSDIATIDDRSEILIDFWVPERYARQIQIGAPLTAQSVGRPDETYEGTVRAIDNQVDNASRTLRVQARISNPSNTLRSGMAFRVEMKFSGDEYPAVNPLAVQWSNDGAFVWAVRNDLALRMPVQIMQRNSDTVLVSGEFEPGDQVVIEGVHAVREGQNVPVAENSGAERKRQGS
ncbi:hemolysin secretion protein D [Nitratireductor aestuarii]|uniref:Hemolysin secretion protein D n=1 Tax=Nitratireductor aestuarii TaxID=1735103 RepID=A0A916W4A3_9HYPH|nr:efflux RND transporter periplasmic adaptor subunit [Nitratireductor aestuarii]GGA64536.1 hemolysin secretion protein D [Nitratireductor aestuarii]